MTMTFIPKILMIVGVAVALGPWMMKIFIEYTRAVFASIPYVIG
jgi:flagellar biosynthetic protein FliQ